MEVFVAVFYFEVCVVCVCNSCLEKIKGVIIDGFIFE